MKEKIELQLSEIDCQMQQAAQDYRDIICDLAMQQSNLQQALLYATDIPPDVQAILDEADKP